MACWRCLDHLFIDNINHHATGSGRMVNSTKIVQDISQDVLCRTVEWISVTSPAGGIKRMNVTRLNSKAGEFGRHLPNSIGIINIKDFDLTSRSRPTTKNSPWNIMVSFILMRNKTIGENPL